MAHCATSATSSGSRPASAIFAALSLVITAKGAYFLADTHINPDPSAAEIAEMAIACREPCAAASASSRRSRCSRAPISARYECALGPEDARRR